MKLTIVLLVVLGIAAAVCAVLLINALDIAGMRSARSKAELSVVTVNQSLPAMTILTEKVLGAETVKLTEAPQGYYTNPAQVVGKVLSLAVVEGQALTSDKIVRGGSSAELAADLRRDAVPGMYCRYPRGVFSSQQRQGGGPLNDHARAGARAGGSGRIRCFQARP
jgi:Flp pilus assembly protein CpaB